MPLRGRGAFASRLFAFVQKEKSMREIALRANDHSLGSLIDELRVHGWSWKSVGAVLGLGGGLISPLIGSVLTAFAWFSGANWHGLAVHRDGTVLFFLTIPLLIFGAHCLDLMDKSNEQQSTED